ncbi:MAG TPA: SMP-30/gluconolactonase/LRE family protein [Mycobacteriales bacterium]|nr:SMP-30/gluconolactonase/LRE family protein [Mycobacteriales bacterium]
MTELTAELLGGPVCTLGEGPVWDAQNQELAWVDILEHKLHRAGLSAEGQLGEVSTTEVPGDLGAAVRVADGGWLLAMAQGFSFLGEDGTITELAQPEAKSGGAARMNDAKTDPRGRWWSGSMGYQGGRIGTLYRVDLDGSITPVLTDVGCSNGLGWSRDAGTMVFNDTSAHTLSAYDFDLETGTLANHRVVAEGFRPDGLTTDDEDTVWSANWDGSEIRHYDLSGRQLPGVRVPVQRTSSCCFAGPNRDLLVITTGTVEGQPEPDAGRLFIARPQVTGPATVRFSGELPRH